jgi:hypothetical protein
LGIFEDARLGPRLTCRCPHTSSSSVACLGHRRPTPSLQRALWPRASPHHHRPPTPSSFSFASTGSFALKGIGGIHSPLFNSDFQLSPHVLRCRSSGFKFALAALFAPRAFAVLIQPAPRFHRRDWFCDHTVPGTSESHLFQRCWWCRDRSHSTSRKASARMPGYP